VRLFKNRVYWCVKKNLFFQKVLKMSASLTKNDYLPLSIKIISLDNTWEFAEDGYSRPYPHEISKDLNTFNSCIKMM
jgi:hypothetical protein